MRNPFRRSRSDQFENESERRVSGLRRRGARIGEECLICTSHFSTEPYLIEIGNRVAIAAGTKFVTHDGLAHLLRRRDPEIQIFGRIRVGSGTFIGLDCIILPGITIGENCIIGAASVVTHDIPDDSLACGNPARIIGTASAKLRELEASPNLLRTYRMSEAERKRVVRKHFGLA
ncbi:MAG TPA: acyltransferase [Bryobacteraceae bacterium]|jgi:acetyltransferase-like isoleucine patch superfamily enzyme|nr:acyltransferase [Bryobacteraceae bacterium]